MPENVMINYRKRGNLFERRNVDYILRNPFYAGIVNWNGQTFEGTHEARYTTEQLDKRIKLMDARRRPAKHRNASTCKHWLSGLIKNPFLTGSLSLLSVLEICKGLSETSDLMKMI